MRRYSLDPGPLDAEARARLDSASVLVVGSGGIGGVVAHVLARSGIGSLVLVDFDRYSEGNLNRQIACYPETLGRPKAEVLAEELGRMGTCGEVVGLVERRRAGEFGAEIAAADLVLAAADDYAFSLALMDRALAAGKPAGAALPIGLWAAAALFLPGGPAPARLFGMPARADEGGYREEIEARRAGLARRFLSRSGGPGTEALAAFAAGKKAPPQLCPVVWSAASLLCLEAVKLLSGVGRPVAAPRYLEIGSRGPQVRRSLILR